VQRILQLLAGLVLLLFAIFWMWIGWKTLQFDPSKDVPILQINDKIVTVAGLLASGVGAGTASVLGIEIQKAAVPGTPGRSMAARVNEAVKSSGLLITGLLVYAGVGTFVLLVWAFTSAPSPDMVGAFALGVIGWLAGAFAAVFRTSSR
jgi:hypothetical protein